ncbi:MAG TPA: hypothetical protein GXX39_02300 [Syntrophothermus lipocalidus]|nr:hypothetical protein [Syntrophothermus lipocalidus]
MWILTQDKKQLIQVNHLAISPSDVFSEHGLWDLFAYVENDNTVRLGSFVSEWEARAILQVIYDNIFRGNNVIQIPEGGTLQYDRCARCDEVIDKSFGHWQPSIHLVGRLVCDRCYAWELDHV